AWPSSRSSERQEKRRQVAPDPATACPLPGTWVRAVGPRRPRFARGCLNRWGPGPDRETGAPWPLSVQAGSWENCVAGQLPTSDLW
ncbi:hypothetical protein WDZ92_47120, partial [Nostoc sp. NIES-2111]